MNFVNKFVFNAMLSGILFSSSSWATQVENPWYIGGGIGWGTTTWQALAPNSQNQNLALSMSTPMRAEEGGLLWGLGLGIEVIPQFQVELNFWDYPDADVYFDPDSLYSFENDDKTSLHTKTYTFVLQGKFLVPWKDTPLRLFASAGAAWLNREDDLLSNELISPTFGVGLNYGFSPHLMGEFGFIYTAGYGESELNPSADFMPFLYGIFTRLYYRWG
jgi:Outer membrane protein beta-barrel domain